MAGDTSLTDISPSTVAILYFPPTNTGHLPPVFYICPVSIATHTRNFFNAIGDPADVRGDGTEHLKLSIDQRHIRYFISREEANVYYGEYALQSVSTDAELREQLEIILDKDAFLSKSFSLVYILWSGGFEIVPTIFYEEEETDDTAGVNDIMSGEARFVFDKAEGIAQLLRSKYPAALHYHSGAVLIETLRRTGQTESQNLFVNVSAGRIEIVYFDASGALRIYNQYEYRSTQDYIYFVLLVADEMGINRAETRAVLMGEVSQDSQLYDMTTRYFRSVTFAKEPADRTFTAAFEGYPMHFNYPLYNL